MSEKNVQLNEEIIKDRLKADQKKQQKKALSDLASNQIALFVIAIIQIMLPFCCHSGHSWRKSLGMTGLFPGCNHSHSMVAGGLEVMS